MVSTIVGRIKEKSKGSMSNAEDILGITSEESTEHGKGGDKSRYNQHNRIEGRGKCKDEIGRTKKDRQ